MNTIPAGTKVRCNYRGEHAGTVLAPDDPRAWAGTLAFPMADPDPAAVRAHVERCNREGWLDHKAPVLWCFGRVYWDSQLVEVAPDPVPDGWTKINA